MKFGSWLNFEETWLAASVFWQLMKFCRGVACNASIWSFEVPLTPLTSSSFSLITENSRTNPAHLPFVNHYSKAIRPTGGLGGWSLTGLWQDFERRSCYRASWRTFGYADVLWKIRIIKNTKSRHMYKIRKVITYTTFLKEVIDGFIGPIGCMMSFAGGSSLSQLMVWGGGFLFLRSVVHLWWFFLSISIFFCIFARYEDTRICYQ